MIDAVFVLSQPAAGDAASRMALLFAKYYAPSLAAPAQQAAAEQLLQRAIQEEWDAVITGAEGKAEEAVSAEGDVLVTSVDVDGDDHAVVCRRLDHVMLVLLGSDEYDELTLTELLANLEAIVVDSAGTSKPTPASVSEHIGKMAVAIDELIFKGRMHTSHLETALKMSKLKPLPSSKT